ncbi:MAG TPA: alanine racemase [Vicinamibacterales bacterium]|nr:alanine racemase [Vicinamibacterales bacterium]
MKLTDLRTPCIIVDHARVERNIDRMQTAADSRRIRLRPHAKTHKSPDLARVQTGRGAIGICCAKLGEAEVFAEAGLEDIRLPYPLQPINADRVLHLLDRTRLSFVVDHLEVARGWSEAMQAAGREVDVLVKVDVGFHRCGIDPDPETGAAFVERVAGLPGLRFRGLLSHAGHAYGAGSNGDAAEIAATEARLLTTLASRVRERGVEVEEISVGATPTARFSLQQDGITEMRPGNYIYYDRTQVALGAATWDDCALTVLARVVSRPARDRVVLDCGSKTLTTDPARGFGGPAGYGVVFRQLDSPVPDEGLCIERLSEEHAVLRVVGGACALEPGDLVRVLPNHACVVSNLVDSVWLAAGDEIVDRLDVAARGRIA